MSPEQHQQICDANHPTRSFWTLPDVVTGLSWIGTENKAPHHAYEAPGKWKSTMPGPWVLIRVLLAGGEGCDPRHDKLCGNEKAMRLLFSSQQISQRIKIVFSIRHLWGQLVPCDITLSHLLSQWYSSIPLPPMATWAIKMLVEIWSTDSLNLFLSSV